MRSVFGLVLALSSAASFAMFAMPIKAPLARLIENAETKVLADPKDVEAQYLLARLHSLGYARDDAQVQVWDPEGRVHVVGPVQIKPESKPFKLSEPALAHLIASLKHYRLALDLDDKRAIFWLGYGWMLEQAGNRKSEMPVTGVGFPDEKLPNRWYVAAYEAYRKAYHSAWPAEVKSSVKGPGYESLVSEEAAQNLLRMDKEKKHRLTTSQVKTLTGHLKLVSTYYEMVTPIVFPTDPWTPYSQIDQPFQSVPFDLDGSGRGHQWSWVSPWAVFLVWNPKGDGVIESGRDLFGNATFWMFFRNGYDALACLDDNRDGFLRGPELRGIAAWRDANSNGQSEPGEVRSLSSYGVTGIATRPSAKVGVVWQNGAGLELLGGATLPTYDWVARSHRSINQKIN